MELLNWQVGIGVVSRLNTPKIKQHFDSLVIPFSRQQHLIVGGLIIFTIDVYQKRVLYTIFQVVMVWSSG